ncbi:MAG: DUF4912 domain-containing protein [Spirochaetales bacterium]|nr:DUF4912 domain-containing protein [Spirochaetales bacterium]
MTKEVLRSLGFKDLKRLVALLDLDISDEVLSASSDSNRDDLIDSIHEELEDVRREREELNTLPIRYQEDRFSSVENLFGTDLDVDSVNFDFPENYNVTRLVLMLRDPAWAFAYWDISYQDRNRLKDLGKNDSLCIVLQEQPRNDDEMLEQVEMPIELSDSRWYINVPRRGTSYQAILGYYGYDNEILTLARSGIVSVPLGTLSENYATSSFADTDLLLALSDLQVLGAVAAEEIPQKVLRRLSELAEL